MQVLNVVVLAAGKGTRMRSKLPKVLHELGGKPLVQHAIDTARQLEAAAICIVIGHGADQIKAALATEENLAFVLQELQRGTGDAVKQALPSLDPLATALVLYGDVPLIRAETLKSLLQLPDGNSMAVLTCDVENSHGLGRIVRDGAGKIRAIVEHKDATDEQRAIREINTGIMAVPVARLHEWLPQLQPNNAQGEYYLTDLVALAIQSGCEVHTLRCDDEVEFMGVNDRVQLAQLERSHQTRLARELLLSGVTLRDPARIDIRGNLQCGVDVEIDINVVVEGRVVIGDNVKIGPNCVLRHCTVGAGSLIEANTIVENSELGANCHVGPFARLRPGSRLDDNAKVGNFVELKNVHVGLGSKINHLSYVGDAILGAKVNVGAGTITCNYDGVNKFKTNIGDSVFVGSNSALVAPVTIASGATIGAGSVITQDVQQDQLAIGRGRQRNIDGWQRPRKKNQ